MRKAKPTVLTRQLWGKRVAVEVKVNSGDELRREISGVRNALRSLALSELFLSVAKGTNTPTELSRLTGKSKFAVSLQLSSLKKVGLLKDRSVIGWDLRRKRYEVVWDRIAEIFRQDHALELEMYENHLIVEPIKEIQGTVRKAGLAISGNGKLGLVREVVPDKLPLLEPEEEQVSQRMNRLVWEFGELFKGYVKERRVATIREYLLGAYEELSEHHSKLPRNSELARFFEFMERFFARNEPIERLWRRYVGKRSTDASVLYKRTPSKSFVVKLFAEAGSADPAGRYLLNAEAQAVIKPGTPLRIYPSYTYPEP
jgi:DNA-binding transcriptional ArsR family regulator